MAWGQGDKNHLFQTQESLHTLPATDGFNATGLFLRQGLATQSWPQADYPTASASHGLGL